MNSRHNALRLGILASFLLLTGCSQTGSMISNLRSSYTLRAVADMPTLPELSRSVVEQAKEDNPGAAIAFMHHERTVEHQFYLERGIWDYVQDIRKQYVVLDPDDEQASTYRLEMGEKDILEGVHLRVISPAGDETVFGRSDLIREESNGDVVYKLAYPRVELGTIVEESIRLRRAANEQYQPPLDQDVALQLDVPVGRMIYRYIYPSTWQMKIKQTSRGRSAPFDVDRGSHPGYTILTSEGTALPAYRHEPYSPAFKEFARYLEFAVTKIYFQGSEAIFEAPESWDDLADTFVEYVMDGSARTSGPIADQARSIVDSSAPDSTKLDSIVRWVQDNIEETDKGGASELARVLRDKKANALLISGLTQAMLEAVGLDAAFVLIHPDREGYFDDAYVQASQFTAPAVVVALGDQTRAVFPYLPDVPVTFIPQEFQGARAMRVNKDGYDGFITLPVADASIAMVNENVDISVDEDGDVTVSEETVLRGAAAYTWRLILDDQDEAERKDLFEDLISYDGVVSDFGFSVDGEDEREAPLTITLTYGVDDLVTLTPEEIIFQTGGLIAPNTLSSFETKPGERRNPIRIYRDELTTKTINVRYPESWTLLTELSDQSDRTRFGSISGTYSLEPGRLTSSQRLELTAGRANATAFSNLSRLVGNESKLYVPTLVFSVGE